jgi:hypothetical protein
MDLCSSPRRQVIDNEFLIVRGTHFRASRLTRRYAVLIISLLTFTSTLALVLVISLGLPTIKRLNEITAPESKDEWKDFKSDLSSHVQNVTLVAALILG